MYNIQIQLKCSMFLRRSCCLCIENMHYLILNVCMCVCIVTSEPRQREKATIFHSISIHSKLRYAREQVKEGCKCCSSKLMPVYFGDGLKVFLYAKQISYVVYMPQWWMRVCKAQAGWKKKQCKTHTGKRPYFTEARHRRYTESGKHTRWIAWNIACHMERSGEWKEIELQMLRKQRMS